MLHCNWGIRWQRAEEALNGNSLSQKGAKCRLEPLTELYTLGLVTFTHAQDQPRPLLGLTQAGTDSECSIMSDWILTPN